MSHYSTLGLLPTASLVEVKRAYRKLALKYHPDKTGGNKLLEAKFLQVNAAYEAILFPKNTSQRHRPSPKPNYKKPEPFINIKKLTLQEDGSVSIIVHYYDVFEIEFNGNRYNIPEKDFIGTFIITKEQLREVDYQVTIRYYASNGGYLDKTWNVRRPKLTVRQKIRKFFKLKY